MKIDRAKLRELWEAATDLPSDEHSSSMLTEAIIIEALEGGGADGDGPAEAKQAAEALFSIARDCEAFAEAITNWAQLPRELGLVRHLKSGGLYAVERGAGGLIAKAAGPLPENDGQSYRDYATICDWIDNALDAEEDGEWLRHEGRGFGTEVVEPAR